MKIIVTFLLYLLMIACSNEAPRQASPVATFKTDSVTAFRSMDETNQADSAEDDYEQFLILIADTGKNYHLLDEQMYAISKRLQIPVDTLNRSYNAKKNLIALAEDDEDEQYAGDYAPRRFPSDYLSIEYLLVYRPDAGEKTMALVSGIYESRIQADSALRKLSSVHPGAFLLEANVFVGCIH